MARLIDANAFWESVSTDYWEHFTQCHTTDQIDLMEMVEENLAEQPTVDAVEVKANVGDFVYALWEAPVKLKYIIYCAEVKEIRISTRNCRLTTTYILEPIDYRGHRREYRSEDFGTLVFKEQEDAERKLYPCVYCFSGTYRSCEGCSYGERKDN